MYNPSLSEQPIDQPAGVISVKQETSILDWLESSGRLLARENEELAGGYLDEEEEIAELMGSDEGYEDIDLDDDDEDLLDLE